MSVDPDNKPNEVVVFTQMEQVEIAANITKLQQQFMQLHPEITAPAGSDLAQMIRQEKQMYASVAIKFVVEFMAAAKKRKEGT